MSLAFLHPAMGALAAIAVASPAFLCDRWVRRGVLEVSA